MKVVAVAVLVLALVCLVQGQAEMCKSYANKCDEMACATACADCETTCSVMESWPEQFMCEGQDRSYSRYDFCPEGSEPEAPLASPAPTASPMAEDSSAGVALPAALLTAAAAALFL